MKTTLSTIVNTLSRKLVSVAQTAAAAGAGSASWFDTYQPKTPEKLQK